MQRLIVTFDLDEAGRAVVAEALAGAGEIVPIAKLDTAARAEALRGASVVLSYNTLKELRPEEVKLIGHVKLVQLGAAGIDFIPVGDLPAGVPVASNAGAFSEPMAEHALAMALCAAKRLMVEHAELKEKKFNQHTPNRMLAGGVCGIFGFGGIGVATARLMRCVGMRVHAINRRGASEEKVEWIGTPKQLDALLAASDVFLVTAPLTRATEGIIGARELGLMKEDAILVNLARGEIIDEGALYEHLKAHPKFTACIDAWWVEPVRHGRFEMGRAFMELPNVIASPHNSASVAMARGVGLKRMGENCRRALVGEAVMNLIGPEDRLK